MSPLNRDKVTYSGSTSHSTLPELSEVELLPLFDADDLSETPSCEHSVGSCTWISSDSFHACGHVYFSKHLPHSENCLAMPFATRDSKSRQSSSVKQSCFLVLSPHPTDFPMVLAKWMRL